MPRLCPTCSRPIPPRTRSRFCPHCSLRGALELAEEDPVPPIDEGRTVGDYELLEVLGRGGMGVVYRARQISLNRPVAVKILLAGEFADESARKRFQAEATAAARLRHPNIITVHEVGEHEGRPFFSMELIEGQTFADLLRDGPIPPTTAAQLLKTVANAVYYAHQQGILHRDLKPSNLLIDSSGHPRISDFGLARRIDVSERMTLTGEVLGSPSYLAPEQARGDRDREGVASDVYSLGAVLYHLITGRPPFLGASPQAILREVIENNPISPRQLNPVVPRDLETICLKSLEKDPARRYGSARELAEELDRFLTRVPLKARPVGLTGQLWRWSLRHPAKAGLAIAALITLVTLATVPTIAYLRISRAEQNLEHQYRETLLTQARAIRLGGNPGQRRDGWTALTNASGGGDASFKYRLKCEAIANLALDDAWFETDTALPPGDGTLLRFDPKQEIYAVGEFKGNITLKDARNHRLLSLLESTNQTLQHVVDFSPDAKYLALRHGEKIAIREVANNRLALSEESGFNQFAFLKDLRHVVFLKSERIVAFELSSGKPAWERVVEKGGGFRTLSISPRDEKIAISTSTGLQIHELQSANAQSIAVRAAISSLRWSPSGRLLAAGGNDGSIRLFDFSNGDISVRTFETQGTVIQALAFSPDEHWVAAAGNDETMRVIDVRGGRTTLGFTGRAFRLDFSPDGQRVGPVWKTGKPGWIYLSNSPVFRMTRFQSPLSVPTLAIDSSGSHCVAASASEMLVFKTDFTAPPNRIPFPNSRAAIFLTNGSLMGIKYEGNACWPPPSPIPAGFGGETASFSSDQSLVAFANYPADNLDILKDGKLLHRLSHERICAAVLHPRGHEVVSTSIDGGEAILWNVQSGAKVRTWPDEGGNRTAYSPDGKWLAQIGPRCVVWNANTWQMKRVLEDVLPNTEGADAVFSPDGRWLAVIMADQEIHLLGVPGFKPFAVLDAPSNARLHRIAWSQSQEKLAVLAAQNEIQIWDIPQLRGNLIKIGADWSD